MPTFGLVVEGTYDEAALKELIRKCAPEGIEVIGRPCGGKVGLMRKFSGYLEGFRYTKEGASVDKALVIRDAENKEPGELKNAMQRKVSSRNYPFPIKLLVIAQELEAWLLADENAVSAVTGKKASVVQNPEMLVNPKERLEQVLSEAEISYTAEVARKIAAGARLETIESRCPSFKEFREAVRDC